MKSAILRTGALALLGFFLAAAGWAQQAPKVNQPKPGQKDQPNVTKAENDAYKPIYNAQNANDSMKVIELGEAFVAKFPMSYYTEAVYAMLTGSYLNTGQTDKMIDAGNKALAINPDDISVLPILAWAIPRRTANAADLQKAQGYAHHGLELLAALQKPEKTSQSDFDKNKNESASMCHDGLGTSDVKTGKYDDAITELNQAIMLAQMPDPVDFYLLGIAEENTSHFTEATASFNKCAANGPMQSQCKSMIDDVKKKSQNSLEAPQ